MELISSSRCYLLSSTVELMNYENLVFFLLFQGVVGPFFLASSCFFLQFFQSRQPNMQVS